MNVLPIVEHHLRLGSRRWTTYWGRLPFAIAAAVFGAGMVAAFNATGSSSPRGLGVMSSFGLFPFLYCLFVGVSATSDSVSVEKREGTLGLLFLTDLKGSDVVLGKLAAGALRPVCNLLAMLPILALGLIVGGLRWVELVRLSAGLLNTLFFSLALGLCISVFSWEQKRTQSNAAGLAVLLWFIVPALSHLLLTAGVGQSFGLTLQVISPSYAPSMSLGSITGGSSDYFWLSILLVHLEAWLFLVLAIWWIPRCWQERNLATGKMRWKERRQQWRYGGASIRERLRIRLLEINPFLWLVSRDKFKTLGVWIYLGAGSGLTLLFVWMLAPPTDGRPELALLITFGFWYLFLKLRLADEAGRHLAAQRSTGNLELVLSTPLSVAEIIDGQWLALRRQFGGPVVVFLLLGLTLLVSGVIQPIQPASLPTASAIGKLPFLAMMVMMVGDALTLGWVGMWLGLKLRKSKEIAQGSVVRVMVLPSLLFLFLTNIAPLWEPLSWMERSSFAFKVNFWLCLGLANDLAFILVSRRKLRRHFRTYATRLYLETDSAGDWGRWLGRRYAQLSRRFFARPTVETLRRS